ncbi:acyl carrier protein [Amycolatopsis sp. VS8301801F10]|uniref:acyl carrier protein n=1 Tax=unclassified Amycolatopsis TaxID=2618356 RepID=UPI0038FC9540
MADLERRVTDVLVAVLDNGTAAEEIGPDADLVDDYGLDSLQMISFLLGVEDELGVQLDYEHLELDDLRVFGRFTGFLRTLAAS